MKKRSIAVLCLGMLLGAGSHGAAAGQNSFSLGPEVSYIEYKEPGIMKETGCMYGLDGAWAHTFNNNYLFKADARLSYGSVDYKNSGTIDSIDDYIIETRAAAGYKFSTSGKTDLTPYIGLGYRYLNDDMSGMTSSTGAYGYERESNYFYSPIGMEVMTRVDNKWSLGAVFEYDQFWRGWQKSHFSDVSSGFDDLDNTQKNGYGLRASLKGLRRGEKIDLIIEPFIRYWNIKKSDDKSIVYAGTVVGYGYEPKNHSTEGGILFSLRWR